MLGLVTLATVTACGRQSTESKPQAPFDAPTETTMKPATSDLSSKLLAGDYGLMFYWPQHDATVQKIWDEPGNPAALEALIDDTSAPPRARFLAAEVLFAKDFTFASRHDPGALARLYASALTGRFTGQANVWGLLWVDDSVGEVGGRFVALGDDAIPVLRELLDDTTLVDWYVGSEEATVGNRQRYRIKDFAAFYLSRMLAEPIAFHADFAARDAAIRKLLPRLENR
jgi:hypothetical protein